MRRCLFTTLSALSLLLCLITMVLWVRTFFVADDVHIGRWESSGLLYHDLHVRWGGDFLHLAFMKSTPGAIGSFPAMLGPRGFAGLHWTHETQSPRYPGLRSWLWWDHYHDQQATYATECWRVQIRSWLLVLLPLFFPAVWTLNLLQQYRSSRRKHSGLCLTCGYDLRASKDRCPECGTRPRDPRSSRETL